MELVEELLDKENEKILSRLDNTVGLSKNKEILRNIMRYHKVKQEFSCDIEFENYNIIIRNESSYNFYEELISVIAEFYYKNGIVLNSDILYIKEKLKDKEIKAIKEGIIVIDMDEVGGSQSEIKKMVEQMIKELHCKAFIIIEDYWREGEINAQFNEIFSWNMKIDKISNKEKEEYIKKFMKLNKLECNNDIIVELADNPYYIIKNKILNILVECKINNENNVNKLLKNKKDSKIISKNKNGMEALDELIGLEEVKEQIKKVINFIKLSKNRQNMPMLHMCFNGNPGTGKTTVARIVGKIFAEEKILSDKNVFVEVQRGDLIGKYVGFTAPKTQGVIDKSLGGVLFIDEAYSIASYIRDEAGGDYGAECIATLLKGMEDHRDNLCVILAGYTKEMKHMLSVNPGFESRIQFTINFPDYSEEELYIIFKKLCKDEKYKISSNIKQVLLEHFKVAKYEKNFSNARYVRSIFEKVKIEQANRTIQDGDDINLIKKIDIENVIGELEPEKILKTKIGFAC